MRRFSVHSLCSVVVLSVALAAAAIFNGHARAGEPSKPNVVFFFIDDK